MLQGAERLVKVPGSKLVWIQDTECLTFTSRKLDGRLSQHSAKVLEINEVWLKPLITLVCGGCDKC